MAPVNYKVCSKKKHTQFWMNSSFVKVVNRFKLNDKKQWNPLNGSAFSENLD